MELRHSFSVDMWCYHNLHLFMCLNNQKSSASELFIFRGKEWSIPKSLGESPMYSTLEENSGSSYTAGQKYPLWITSQSAQWFKEVWAIHFLEQEETSRLSVLKDQC